MSKGQMIQAWLIVAVTVFSVACNKSKTSRATNASSAAAIVLSSSSYNLQPGAQAMITASGGTGTYTTYNASQGTLQLVGKGQYSYTAPTIVSGVASVTISVSDSAGTTGVLTINVNGQSSSNSLAVYTSQLPIPVGGTVQLSVQGGTGPYTWQITSGGGTLSSNTGATVSYTAPASTGSVGLTVSDSAGNSLSGSIPISGVSQQQTCSGYYAINAQGATGTLYLVPTGTGAVTGTLIYDGGSTANLSGTCTATAITFTTSDGSVYSGGFYFTNLDPYIASMVGTFNGGQWVAVPKR